MADFTDEQIDELRLVFNGAYCQLRMGGITGGDAEREAMRVLLARVGVSELPASPVKKEET